MEKTELVPRHVWERVEKAVEFINEMTLPDGSFPDYGDRDDGFVFRPNGTYDESPFPGLLNTAAFLFNRTDWCRDSPRSKERLHFWTGKSWEMSGGKVDLKGLRTPAKPMLKTYPQGGMSLMKWDKGRLLFRHAPLGSGSSCGHGHADALSILFYWNSVPVLIDLGSGQYNGDQDIRNFFRSTIAHNTVEIGQNDQARILGPFMWEKSYETKLEKTASSPFLYVKASHNGYEKEFSVIHTRKVLWSDPFRVEIHDSFSGSKSVPMRGAFHLGECRSVVQNGNIIQADFPGFVFSISLPSEFTVKIYYGSREPFMGWRSTIYGKWEPIHSLIFSGQIQENFQYGINLEIAEK